MIYRCTRCESGLVYDKKAALLYCKFCGSFYSAEFCTEEDIREMSENEPVRGVDHFSAGRPTFDSMSMDFPDLDEGTSILTSQRSKSSVPQKNNKPVNLFEEPDDLFRHENQLSAFNDRGFWSGKEQSVFQGSGSVFDGMDFQSRESGLSDGLPKIIPTQNENKTNNRGSIEFSADNIFDTTPQTTVQPVVQQPAQTKPATPSPSLASIESAFASATQFAADNNSLSSRKKMFSGMDFDDDFEDQQNKKPDTVNIFSKNNYANINGNTQQQTYQQPATQNVGYSAPVVEEPVAETHVPQFNVPQYNVTQSQPTVEPAVQQTYSQPAYEQPMQQTYSQPAYQQPEQQTYSQPAYQQPEQQTYSQPAYQQPEQQTYSQPAYQQPVQQTYSQPVQPAAEKPKNFDYLFNTTQTGSFNNSNGIDDLDEFDDAAFNRSKGKATAFNTSSTFKPESEKVDVNEPTDIEMKIYFCTTCNTKVMVHDGDVSSYCSFCGNSTVIYDRTLTLDKPKKILPFRLTKENAMNVIKDRLGYNRYSLDEVRDLEIDEVNGVYIPYWVYQTEIERSMDITVTEEVPVEGPMAKKGQTETRTSNYSKKGSNRYHVYLDACKSLNDVMAERLEPFHMDKMVKFNTTHLRGYYAEKYDIVSAERLEDAHVSSQMFMDRDILSQVPGVKKDEKDPDRIINVEKKNIQEKYEVLNTEYVLLPVYFVSVKYMNHSYSVIVNGQTGKVVSNLPLNQQKVKADVIKNGILTGLVFSMLFMLFTSVNFGALSLNFLLALPLAALGYFGFIGYKSKKKYDESYYRMQLSKLQKYAEEGGN